jgi:hypothetical protein
MEKTMTVQTRSNTGELRYFMSLEIALAIAKTDPHIWKISFNAEDGTRIRLVRIATGWTYENIDGNRFI